MTESPTADDATLALLQRQRAGEKDALEALLSEILPWLHREVSRAMGSQPRVTQDSMDLVQTAVLNFLAWGPRFQPRDGGQFRALLRRIALNELIDQRRRSALIREGRQLDSLGSASNPLSGFAAAGLSSLQPSRAAEKREELEWVRLALQFLPAEERQLILLSEVEGLEWAAVARELGLASADAARVRAMRLKPRLANLLRQLKSGMLPPTPDE
jgi:RNA polymerase sigma factor (sigma-70 family)